MKRNNNMTENFLANLVLAPYLIKASALIGVERKIGGNQFRHAIMTLGILLDYKITDYQLLKASLIHDLIEDIPNTDINELRLLDEDGNEVVDLVLEVSRRPGEEKPVFLNRILESGSIKSQMLKTADRISNLLDLQLGFFTEQKITEYLDETEKYVVPMAKNVNSDMLFEIQDLIQKRRKMISH